MFLLLLEVLHGFSRAAHLQEAIPAVTIMNNLPPEEDLPLPMITMMVGAGLT